MEGAKEGATLLLALGIAERAGGGVEAGVLPAIIGGQGADVIG